MCVFFKLRNFISLLHMHIARTCKLAFVLNEVVIVDREISARFPITERNHDANKAASRSYAFARIPFPSLSPSSACNRTRLVPRILWKCNIPSLISRCERSEKSVAGKMREINIGMQRQRCAEIRLLSSFNFWRRLYQEGNLVNVAPSCFSANLASLLPPMAKM